MNTPMKEKETVSHNEHSVKGRVFAALDEGQIAPHSKYVFLCQDWLVWGLWTLSIVIGALSIAVLIFASTHRYFDIYEATHENFVTFMLEALPFVWLGVFAGMLGLAAWQLRNTRRGYRLSTVMLGVSSFVFSVILGGLFHLGGFGWSLDMWLGQVAPMYDSQAKMEQKMWQNPQQGRLIGGQSALTSSSPATIFFDDIADVRWEVSVAELSTEDKEYLAQGHKVRLLGAIKQNKDAFARFHACGVFPWMMDEPTKVAAISEERQVFVERMYKHYEDAKSRREAIEDELADQTQQIASSSPCHQMAAVRRVHESMHP